MALMTFPIDESRNGNLGATTSAHAMSRVDAWLTPTLQETTAENQGLLNECDLVKINGTRNDDGWV